MARSAATLETGKVRRMVDPKTLKLSKEQLVEIKADLLVAGQAEAAKALFGHIEGVWAVAGDKFRVVSASHDRTIKIWDRDNGTCQTTLVGHRGAVTCLALADDKIVSGSDDGDVKIWDFGCKE